ncbi:MAG TPA: flagellar motor switch protein FliM [Thermodesulfobacteriota bacterium]|nr:flagellar motor switch protein FliM [Thermodesulfobacteriota bacterium]
MSDILSQDEVDLLLRAVEAGEVETETPDEGVGGVRPYDITNQERIIRGRMPGLDIANDRFARFLRNSISGFIMRFVDVSVHSTELMKFSEFMKIVPFPSSINIFKIESPFKGYALLVFEAPLIFTLVEFFFGGKTASWFKPEGRSFTVIEQRVIKKLVKAALEDLVTAWENIAPLGVEYVSSEMNPHFITIVTPSEIVIKVEVHVEIEDFKGRVFICIPYALIEPVKERLYSGIQSEMSVADQRWVGRLEEILMDSYVEVRAKLEDLELTLEELLNLEVGSVISLDRSVEEEVIVEVEGVPKFKGVSGYSRGNQAIKITKIL